MLSETDQLLLALDTSLKSAGIRRRTRGAIKTELREDYFDAAVAQETAEGMSLQAAERRVVERFGPLEAVVAAYVEDWRRYYSDVRRRVICVAIPVTAAIIAVLAIPAATPPQNYTATAYTILTDFNGANGTLDGFAPWLAADCVFGEAPTGQLAVGRTQVVRAIARWKRAFPDARGTIVDIEQHGNQVRVKLRWTGTQSGPLTTAQGTFPPSGRHVRFPAVVVLTMHDGKIARLDHTFDPATLLDQIR